MWDVSGKLHFADQWKNLIFSLSLLKNAVQAPQSIRGTARVLFSLTHRQPHFLFLPSVVRISCYQACSASGQQKCIERNVLLSAHLRTKLHLRATPQSRPEGLPCPFGRLLCIDLIGQVCLTGFYWSVLHSKLKHLLFYLNFFKRFIF